MADAAKIVVVFACMMLWCTVGAAGVMLAFGAITGVYRDPVHLQMSQVFALWTMISVYVFFNLVPSGGSEKGGE